jgi:hypothetical protein
LPIVIEDAVATAPFSIDTAVSTCHGGMQLAARRSCTFSLTYKASAVGKQSGTLTITNDSRTNGRLIVNLSGSGKL